MGTTTDICRRDGEKGLLLPATTAEYDWSDEFRGALYAAAMVYLFLGVSMIADTFVASIEEITSQRRKVLTKAGEVRTPKVWNETVANLSLMALGSSAPEIFLSVIDLFRQKMFASELGAFTIVGSAAFNLFVIVAVCISVIPSTDGRKIKEIPVFYLTALFSIFAYVWLVFILLVSTPDIVDIWEAAVTLAFLPILIGFSYRVDIGSFGDWHVFRRATGDPAEAPHSPPRRSSTASSGSSEGSSRKIAISSRGSAFRRSNSGRNSSRTLGATPTVNWRRSHTHAKHRLMASITGGDFAGKVSHSLSGRTSTRRLTGDRGTSNQYPTLSGNIGGESFESPDNGLFGVTVGKKVSMASREDNPEPVAWVQFKANYQCMSKDAPVKRVSVVRSGEATCDLRVRYVVRECEAPPPANLVVACLTGDNAGMESSSVAAGGFRKGEAVVAARDLSIEGTVVEQGTPGTVLGSAASDADNRLAVAFRGVFAQDDPQNSLCVLPDDIERVEGLLERAHRTGAEGDGDGGAAKAAAKTLATGELLFETGDEQKEIAIDRATLSNSTAKRFTVAIQRVVNCSEGIPGRGGVGALCFTQVVLTPPQTHGMISFHPETLVVKNTGARQFQEILVLRTGGSTGSVTCEYHTERLTAVPGYHYTDIDGVVEFDEGVTEQTIEVEILPKSEHRVSSEFLVVLEDIQGATVSPEVNGAPDSAMLLVTIPPASSRGTCLRAVDGLLNLDSIKAGSADWFSQALAVPWVNGSREAQAEAGLVDLVFHLVSLPWKLLFCLVPSTTLFGGKLCFLICLVFIGLLTGVVADFAELFGCVLGIPNEVTAITFVALGTSMPDLFASKAAAVDDPTADASVVNVTGSNSVNVFLGLGLPWTIGSIYWAIVGRTSDWEDMYPDMRGKLDRRGISGAVFVVQAKDLAFNVLVFCICCSLGLCLLFLRRRIIGVELGGPWVPKVTTSVAFLSLWFGYIIIACWRSARGSGANLPEKSAVLGGTSVALLLFWLAALWTSLQYRRNGGPRLSSMSSACNGDADGAPDTASQTMSMSMSSGSLSASNLGSLSASASNLGCPDAAEAEVASPVARSQKAASSPPPGSPVVDMSI